MFLEEILLAKDANNQGKRVILFLREETFDNDIEILKKYPEWERVTKVTKHGSIDIIDFQELKDLRFISN